MSDDNDGEWEEHAAFIGSCTCAPWCPAQDDPEKHGWGCCGNGDCLCEAGWEE